MSGGKGELYPCSNQAVSAAHTFGDACQHSSLSTAFGCYYIQRITTINIPSFSHTKQLDRASSQRSVQAGKHGRKFLNNNPVCIYDIHTHAIMGWVRLTLQVTCDSDKVAVRCSVGSIASPCCCRSMRVVMHWTLVACMKTVVTLLMHASQ